MTPLYTPDRRYIVVNGRLWRATNPNLSETERDRLVQDLMNARRRVRLKDPAAKAQARGDLDRAKHALGERGPVWWTDGAADYNRRLAKNTHYADWFGDISTFSVGGGHEGTAGSPLRSCSSPED
ncbi:hypothetical protein [Devosia sp. UYZn731]|uniref:hypothetical protein n=1 Tax=Devosia sp. UYZn731 TaxID=3156345 RepID=UPI00339A0096